MLEALHELYPEAPVFTLVYDKHLADQFEGWTIVSSPLQFLYKLVPRFQLMLPFIPLALKAFDFSEFDVVISSSSIFAKNISVPKRVLHINYCHTPARFLWDGSESYIHEEVPAVLRPLVRKYLNWMRKWDYKASQRVDFFVANSKNIQNKIKQHYNRDSVIIHPYVDLDKFYPTVPKENYFVAAGRLQPHKKIGLVVKVFNELGLPLHVIGTGRDLPYLKSIAKDNIDFLGRVDDRILCDEYSGAKAFIYPQEEDFGMMPLEAAAAGTPTIAYGKGGALETVVGAKTGIFFEHQTEQELKDAVIKIQHMHFGSEELFEQAEKFSKEKFKQQVKEFVQKCASR